MTRTLLLLLVSVLLLAQVPGLQRSVPLPEWKASAVQHFNDLMMEHQTAYQEALRRRNAAIAELCAEAKADMDTCQINTVAKTITWVQKPGDLESNSQKEKPK